MPKKFQFFSKKVALLTLAFGGGAFYLFQIRPVLKAKERAELNRLAAEYWTFEEHKKELESSRPA